MRGINELIDDMIKAVNGISPSLGLGEEGEKAALLLALLKDRLKHPDGPLAVVMCGPTGAGKSHLFNFLVGEDISPSSYKRPSTVAPVLAASPETSSAVNKADFLPDYKKIATKSPISFEIGDDRRLYTAEVKTPPWGWPPELALIDAPDFDSVMEKNQSQATDMARRADAVILVAHQAKYADQSAWDFLEEEKKRDRPLLVILNRVTAEAVEADFSARLEALNIKAALLTWPEEGAAEQTPVNAARGELTRWLTGLSARSREITAENGRRETARLGELMRGEIISRLTARENELTRRLGDVRRLTAEWTANPQKHLSLNLPGEMKEALMKNLGETVRRSDLWAGPRRVISRPFALVGEQLKKLFNDDPKAASNLAD
ncbi:MAG: dynamin family protein, partial [Candidatus Adiutrix sp.]|nr:dynamin family protein [Candidatus Adiutrix sp.]